ncbi:MAG: hypothetical protein NVS1B14_10660 [Vulcanimicrobiaceae bacterium]
MSLKKALVAALITAAILLLPALGLTAPLPQEAFGYNAAAPLGVKILQVHHQDNLTVEEITFPSPKGGLVRARLMLPQTPGHRGAVLFVHWLGDPKTTNRTEFARDGLTIAKRGSVALLVDAMWSMPDWYEKGRAPEDDYANSIKQIVDLRRALDVLLAQRGVDPHRIAYVGHDFGAMYGAVLSGVDVRPRWYVLMAGNPSFEKWYTYEAKPKDPQAYTVQMEQLEPGGYLARSKAEAMLFQFAGKDQYVSADEAQKFAGAAPLPRGTFVYNTGHGLNVPEAFADRMAWLAERLVTTP